MLFVLGLASILTASLLASARPADSATVTGGKLPAALWINGEPFDRLGQRDLSTLGGVSINPREDVLTTATNLLRIVDVVPNADLGTRNLEMEVRCWENVGRGWKVLVPKGTLNLSITTELDYCRKSGPLVVKKDELFICQTSSCSETLIFTHTVTKTTTYGYKITTGGTAGGNIGVIKLEFSPEFSFSSEWSTTTIDTETVSRTINFMQGESCAATTIQADLNCFGRISLMHGVWSRDGRQFDTDLHGLKIQFSDDGDCQVPGLSDIIRAMETNSSVSMDLGTQAPGSPWRVEGCMFT